MTPDEIDVLVADKFFAGELGISLQTVWRNDNDPRMADQGWPAKVKQGLRNFRSRKALEAYKARLVRQAFKHRHAAHASRETVDVSATSIRVA